VQRPLPDEALKIVMRESGVRGTLIYCADYRCDHSMAINGRTISGCRTLSCASPARRAASVAQMHGPIHIRPVPGQEFPTHLHVECSKDLVNPRIHPVGTRFRLRVKLTDRQGGGAFLYSYFGWPVEVVERPE
jgi:hypothetical protein